MRSVFKDAGFAASVQRLASNSDFQRVMKMVDSYEAALLEELRAAPPDRVLVVQGRLQAVSELREAINKHKDG